MRWLIGLLCIILLIACQKQGEASFIEPPGTPALANSVLPNQVQRTSSSANTVYFVLANGGEIDANDLQQHPELTVVHTFAELTKVSENKSAIWIDKNVADQVERDWLVETPQLAKTIVVVGYHDSLYAFREALPAFGIQGPEVDWSQTRISPGFSVWKWKTYTASAKSAWKRGYDQPSTIDNIVTQVSPLQGTETIVDQYEAFDAVQAVAAVLRDHPEFPLAGDTQAIETITGGPAPGMKVAGTLSTTVEPATEPGTYIVTLSKRWDLVMNDKALVGYWKYKVSPQNVQLVDSEDNTDLVQLVR